jgi:hypothetical protein
MKKLTSKLIAIFALVFVLGTTATASAAAVTCTPIRTGTFSSRVHVRCSQSFSGIIYFAVSMADSEEAQRFLSVVTSALLAGRNIVVYYDPADLSGGSFGCLTSDCRRATGVEIVK